MEINKDSKKSPLLRVVRRRRMIKSEIDRLLSDEGTRNLLSGIMLNKNTPTNNNNNNKKQQSNRIVTRNKTINNNTGNNKKVIVKKSLSLLGHRTQPGGNTSTTTVSNSFTSGGDIINNNNSNLIATSSRDNILFLTLAYRKPQTISSGGGGGGDCEGIINNQDLRELSWKLEETESRSEISVIVLNSSSDRIFCDGLDYKELIQPDFNKRKIAITNRIHCIKNLLLTLSKSKKLLVASVNGGRVNNFGVILLAFFDLVYANDKSTFSLQTYYKLKHCPEGLSAFNQTQLNSTIMKSLLYTSRSLTSTELFTSNYLITEILWDGSHYHEQLASRLLNINSNEITKSIYKTFTTKNIKQINTDFNFEFGYLENIWNSDLWQQNATKTLFN